MLKHANTKRITGQYLVRSLGAIFVLFLLTGAAHAELVPLTGITQIVTGDTHACALTMDGAVKCWGNNYGGQLGNGSQEESTTPVEVFGLDSGVQAISAGGDQTCALTTAGAVKCWGLNDFGELGDGSYTSSSIPVNVIGLDNGVQAISVDVSHACALTMDGAVKCWGNNYGGQLGNGSQEESTTPVEVFGLGSGVQAISAGRSHTCALTEGGAVKCWGDNTSGQLGDGTTTSSPVPVNVTGLDSGVQAINAGYSHTCALTEAGAAKCWGANANGQLGNDTTADSPVPVNVTGLDSGVQAINAGYSHTCALTEAGAAKCWGYNGSGQLGDGTTTDSSLPVDVIGLESTLQSISAVWDYTCALTLDGGVKCWGGNDFGHLGDGSPTYSVTPVDVITPESNVQVISAGSDHTCAVTMDGAAMCWGYNYSGQLGDGGTTSSSTPVNVSVLDSSVQAISPGSIHTCALSTSGGVKCWGGNDFGQLGDGTTTSSFLPVDVTGLENNVKVISAGSFHTCAVTMDGAAMCWGYNHFGQLGDGGTASSSVPVAVIGLDSGVQAISTGSNHTCALTEDGAVKCWGYNHYGQLGDDSTTNSTSPVDVVGLGSGVQAISAGGDQTCALTTAGAVKCWGDNRRGQLGDGTTTDSSVPVSVTDLGNGIQAIGVGSLHNCALTSGGAVKCLGGNASGQLGDGSTTISSIPVGVIGLANNVQAISAGSDHTCALSNGAVKCWGANDIGQLGNGRLIFTTTPVDVLIDQPPPVDLVIQIEPDPEAEPQSRYTNIAQDNETRCYKVTVTNTGGEAALDVLLQVAVSEAMDTVTWTCTVANGCSPANGTGDVATQFDLDGGGSTVVGLCGNVKPDIAFVDITASATSGGVTHASSQVNDPANGIGVFKNGFE